MTLDLFQQVPTSGVERHIAIGEGQPSIRDARSCRRRAREYHVHGISKPPRRQRNCSPGPARARPLCRSTRRRRWLGQAAFKACQYAERRERAGRPVLAPQMVRIECRGVTKEAPASASSSLVRSYSQRIQPNAVATAARAAMSPAQSMDCAWMELLLSTSLG